MSSSRQTPRSHQVRSTRYRRRNGGPPHPASAVLRFRIIDGRSGEPLDSRELRPVSLHLVKNWQESGEVDVEEDPGTVTVRPLHGPKNHLNAPTSKIGRALSTILTIWSDFVQKVLAYCFRGMG
jgi:hypothetical protein